MVETASETEGRRLLRERLCEGVTQRWLADLLEIKQSSVSLWVSGKARPEAHYRLALWKLWRIPQRAWLTTSERRMVRRARKAAPATDPSRAAA